MQNVVRVGESAASTPLERAKKAGMVDEFPSQNVQHNPGGVHGHRDKSAGVRRVPAGPPKWRGRAPRGIASAAAVKTEPHVEKKMEKKKNTKKNYPASFRQLGWGGAAGGARQGGKFATGMECSADRKIKSSVGKKC